MYLSALLSRWLPLQTFVCLWLQQTLLKEIFWWWSTWCFWWISFNVCYLAICIKNAQHYPCCSQNDSAFYNNHHNWSFSIEATWPINIFPNIYVQNANRNSCWLHYILFSSFLVFVLSLVSFLAASWRKLILLSKVFIVFYTRLYTEIDRKIVKTNEAFLMFLTHTAKTQQMLRSSSI